MSIPIKFDSSLSLRKTGRRMEDCVFYSLKTVTGSFGLNKLKGINVFAALGKKYNPNPPLDNLRVTMRY